MMEERDKRIVVFANNCTRITMILCSNWTCDVLTRQLSKYYIRESQQRLKQCPVRFGHSPHGVVSCNGSGRDHETSCQPDLSSLGHPTLSDPEVKGRVPRILTQVSFPSFGLSDLLGLGIIYPS